MIKGKDLLTLDELSGEEILEVLDLADRLKEERRRRVLRPLLAGRTLAMIFEKPSTRTRVSFEAGVFELGGHAINLGTNEIQLSRGESIEDTARTLSRYAEVIMARVNFHEEVVRLADAAPVPVINGLSDLYHPCQTLADLQTIGEAKGGFRGLKLAWIGDGNNVCNSLLIGCAKVGMNIAVATPSGFDPLPAAVSNAKKLSKSSGSTVEIFGDPHKAITDADAVVTDTFVSMGREAERSRRRRAFLPKYRITQKLMGEAKDDAIFMHCLPAKRGEEVEAEVIDGPQSVVWAEAENRLHSQKALLCLLLLDADATARRARVRRA